MRPLRIAMHVHSVNPRGGVVHALSLAEAIQALGHRVTLFAPATLGQKLFRSTTVDTCLFPARRIDGELATLVRQRIGEYIAAVRYHPDPFDVHHAHDGMSGCAMAQLRLAAEIGCYFRTVHHLDHYADEYLNDAQRQSILTADCCLSVSQIWADHLRRHYGISAACISNGVDGRRFHPQQSPSDRAASTAISGLGNGPVLLSVGGIEARKNAINILRAFELAQPHLPVQARLVFAGGASLLDHGSYQREFQKLLRSSKVHPQVLVTGPLPDDAMPMLYQRAAMLLFPSLVEGFGLAVLEAMASGTPVITSRIPPFTEYLTETDAMLVDPGCPEQIADSIIQLSNPATAVRYATRGLAVAARFTWSRSATQHVDQYQQTLNQLGAGNAGNALCGPLAR